MLPREKFLINTDSLAAELSAAGDLGRLIVNKASTSIVFRGEPEDWIDLTEQNIVFELFNCMEDELSSNNHWGTDGIVHHTISEVQGKSYPISFSGLEASVSEYLDVVDSVVAESRSILEMRWDVESNNRITKFEWYQAAKAGIMMLDVMDATKSADQIHLRSLTYNGWTYKLLVAKGFVSIGRGKYVSDNWCPHTSNPSAITVIGNCIVTDQISDIEDGDLSG